MLDCRLFQIAPVSQAFSMIVSVFNRQRSAAACVAAYFAIALPALPGDLWRWGVLVLPLAAVVALHPRVFAPVSDARSSRGYGSRVTCASLSIRRRAR
jgi:hypothetical protein